MTGYFRENSGQTSPEGSGGCESVCVLPFDPGLCAVWSPLLGTKL